ncbi:MAG: GAF domain-containing protein, partial [Anaerolinea sp.]|nr:GAF domain-containing protein [Anaerolinea sp.]
AVVLQNQALLNAARINAEILAARVSALETLNRLSVDLGRFIDEQELLDYTTRTIAESVRVDHVGLVTLDADGWGGVLTSEWPLTGIIGQHFDFRNDELYKIMLQNMPEPLVLQHALSNPQVSEGTKKVFQSLGIQSLMFLPIMLGNRMYASLGLDFFDPQRVISEADVALARTIVGQVSVALQNVRLLSDTRRRADQLQRIADFGRSVSATFDFATIHRIMLTETAQMLTVDRILIALFDPITGGLRFVGRYENERSDVRVDAPVDPTAAGSVAGEVWKQQRFVYHPDTLELPGTRHKHDIGLRSIMGVPIRLRGRIMGSVVVGCFRPEMYSETDQALFQQIVNQFAVALDNAEAYAQSQRIARAEALVSEISVKFQRAANLRHMSEIALRELAAAVGATHARIRLSPLEERAVSGMPDQPAQRPAFAPDGADVDSSTADSW